jgi:hypothetical protein
MRWGAQMQKNSPERELLGCLPQAVFGLAILAAWAQHLYTCFTTDRWGFLVAGAIFFPIAVVHGFGVWLGFWH